MANFDSLSPEERLSYYRDLEGRITSLIRELDDALSPEERAWTLEFAGHNEFGLALETLYDSLVERGHSVEARVADVVRNLAASIDLHSRDWDSLRNL
jgi:hypothetical protein